MFMSTRYKKRPEPLTRKRPIFSADDSLAKLCEVLNNESSVTKLITPKYKDFRSQKLKFDQKTRLNNAIWRAWHIQYKMNTKARFLQFAAPFSDETQHSISQAVLLEGKYWRRRLDAVLHEFKKWRRLHGEKLLKNSGAMIKSISAVQGDLSSDSELDEREDESVPKPDLPVEKSLDTLSAMYAFPDTLFSSCLDMQKDIDNNPKHQLSKDSSGMIQPSLNHLNPSFDELLDNFDFLLSSDFSNYHNSHQQSDNSMLSMQQQQDQQQAYTPMQHTDTTQHQSNMVHHQSHQENYPNLSNMMFQPHSGDGAGGKHACNMQQVNDTGMQDQNSFRNEETFQQLPPQLQAPNLASRIQAAMSTRPKGRGKSESGKSQKRDNSGPSNSKRAKRQHSHEKALESNKHIAQKKFPESHNNSEHHGRTNNSRPRSASSIPILPKGGNEQNHIVHPAKHPSLFFVGSDIQPRPHHSNYTIPAAASATPHHASASAAMPYVIMSCVPVITQNSQPIAKNTPTIVEPQHYHHPQTYPSSQQHQYMNMMTSQQTNNRHTPINHHQQTQAANTHQHHNHHSGHSTPTPDNSISNQQQMLHLQNAVSQLSGINDTQLVQLAQLLQNVPQGTEATLSYLELLQQQLHLMLKHQHENIEFKQQVQQQAEKMLTHQNPSSMQHSYPTNAQHQQQHQLQSATQHVSSVQSPVIVSSAQQQPYSSYQPQHSTYDHATNTSSKKKRGHPTTQQQHERYSRQSSLEIPLPKNLQEKENPHTQSPVYTRSNEPTLNIPINRSSPATTLNLPQPLATNDRQQKTSDVEQPTSSGCTTLDSAIALVALRHGSISPEVPVNLSRSIKTGEEIPAKRITILRGGETITSSTETRPSVSTTGAVGEITISNESSASSSDNRVKEVQDRTVYNEHRRQCHLSAEQRRRGMIKNAFEELSNMLYLNNFIQGPINGKPPKLSNAAILQNTCDYIQELVQERASCDVNMNKIQQEIEEMRNEISKCQKRLPSSGADTSLEGSNTVEKGFLAYCKDLIKLDRKSWIFSAIVRPLFDSYNKSVRTKTIDDFVESVIQWVDSHFTLPNLRLVILETLTKLSTSTAILDDSDCLNDLAASALRIDDPTDINATAEGVQQQQSTPSNPSNQLNLPSSTSSTFRTFNKR
eukprot:TCONS_00058323-protein